MYSSIPLLSSIFMLVLLGVFFNKKGRYLAISSGILHIAVFLSIVYMNAIADYGTVQAVEYFKIETTAIKFSIHWNTNNLYYAYLYSFCAFMLWYIFLVDVNSQSAPKKNAFLLLSGSFFVYLFLGSMVIEQIFFAWIGITIVIFLLNGGILNILTLDKIRYSVYFLSINIIAAALFFIVLKVISPYGEISQYDMMQGLQDKKNSIYNLKVDIHLIFFLIIGIALRIFPFNYVNPVGFVKTLSGAVFSNLALNIVGCMVIYIYVLNFYIPYSYKTFLTFWALSNIAISAIVANRQKEIHSYSGYISSAFSSFIILGYCFLTLDSAVLFSIYIMLTLFILLVVIAILTKVLSGEIHFSEMGGIGVLQKGLFTFYGLFLSLVLLLPYFYILNIDGLDAFNQSILFESAFYIVLSLVFLSLMYSLARFTWIVFLGNSRVDDMILARFKKNDIVFVVFGILLSILVFVLSFYLVTISFKASVLEDIKKYGVVALVLANIFLFTGAMMYLNKKAYNHNPYKNNIDVFVMHNFYMGNVLKNIFFIPLYTVGVIMNFFENIRFDILYTKIRVYFAQKTYRLRSKEENIDVSMVLFFVMLLLIIVLLFYVGGLKI